MFGGFALFMIAITAAVVGWVLKGGQNRDRERSRQASGILELNRQLAHRVFESGRVNVQLEHRMVEQTLQLQQAVERLRSANQELERFAYIAAHDLQEPLRQVAGFNSLLLVKFSGTMDSTARVYLEQSVEGVKRLQGMLNGLLTYSLITPMSVRPAPTRLEPLIRAAVDNASRAFDDVNCSIRLDLEECDLVLADPHLIQQVIGSLVSNAIKFRSAGLAPEIDVTLRQGPEDWRLTVTDNGIGIEEEFAPRIFEVFARLHPVGRFDGAGVGLAIARKIIEYHGGQLLMRPAPSGHGASFAAIVPSHAIVPIAGATGAGR